VEVLFLTSVFCLSFYSSSVYGPLLVALGLLYPVAAMISYISREKELRQKELMKMMSVTESDIGWAWYITFFALSVVTASGTAGVSAVLYENSDPLYLWIFWLLTFNAVVVFSMLMASFTSRSTRNVLIGLLVFFIGVFLTLAVDYETGSRYVFWRRICRLMLTFEVIRSQSSFPMSQPINSSCTACIQCFDWSN